jgi:hypothetical protein
MNMSDELGAYILMIKFLTNQKKGNEEKETPSFFQKFWKALKESEPRMWPKRLMDLLTKSFVRKTPVKLYSESEEKGLSIKSMFFFF